MSEKADEDAAWRRERLAPSRSFAPRQRVLRPSAQDGQTARFSFTFIVLFFFMLFFKAYRQSAGYSIYCLLRSLQSQGGPALRSLSTFGEGSSLTAAPAYRLR